MAEKVPILKSGAGASQSSDPGAKPLKWYQKIAERSCSGYMLKLVLAGKYGVGKTALAYRMVKGIFETSSPVTSGMFFVERNIKFEVDINVRVWDTAGIHVPTASGISELYFHAANAVIFVYDITNKKSFDELDEWMHVVRRYCDNSTIFALVGNKIDQEENRAVPHTRVNRFALRYNMETFETSAASSEGVESMFISLVQILNNKEMQKREEMERERTNRRLTGGSVSYAIETICRRLLCTRIQTPRIFGSVSRRASYTSVSTSGPTTSGTSTAAPSTSISSISVASPSFPIISAQSSSIPSASGSFSLSPTARSPYPSGTATLTTAAASTSAQSISAPRPSLVSTSNPEKNIASPASSKKKKKKTEASPLLATSTSLEDKQFYSSMS